MSEPFSVIFFRMCRVQKNLKGNDHGVCCSHWSCHFCTFCCSSNTCLQKEKNRTSGLVDLCLTQKMNEYSIRKYNMMPVQGNLKRNSFPYLIVCLCANTYGFGLYVFFYVAKNNRHFRVADDFSRQSSLQYDLKTIEAATLTFSKRNMLGQGGFGEVFKVQHILLQEFFFNIYLNNCMH